MQPLPGAAALPCAQGAGPWYYAWQTGQQRVADQQTPARETALVKAFGVHQRRYGTRRLQVTLRQNGHRVGRQRLHTAMRRRACVRCNRKRPLRA